ncbi:MAG: biofilm development regulator YmgB/AriR family protein [Klebsiella sp.]|nr:biofilm development regulator YmgB/AriR family protein [Klebsiella sp.]
MHQQPDIYAGLQDTALSLSDYFRTAGDKLVDESAVMSLAINSILQSEGHLNNKAIILWLIQALESTDDVVTADVIRKTLEIVVGYTRHASGPPGQQLPYRACPL